MGNIFLSNIILMIILILALISKNNSLSVAISFILFINLLRSLGGGFEEGSLLLLEKLKKYGLKIGIIILTMGIISPIALGEIKPDQFLKLLKSSTGIVAILSGIIVSVLASRGGFFLDKEPEMVFTIVFGTIIGILLFKGYPIGPLVGSGIAAMILSIINLFK